MNRTMKNKKGFTLMEMLIVVAVIAILVAVAIPVYNAQMHKARVAADWANVRAYYAELQTDYLTTGMLRPDTEVLNGQEVTLQAGSYLCRRLQDQNNEPVAYHITYYCNEHHEEHNLTLG